MTATKIPQHIAIIMDGNGRWAKQRFLPRIAGHQAGAKTVRKIVRYCVEKKIEVLTLFAFSSENWRRPKQEVKYLMSLFITVLKREVKKMHQQNIQLRIIGDRTKFNNKLQEAMTAAEELTAANTGLKLIVAANYGGRWDIRQAMYHIALQVENKIMSSEHISTTLISNYLAFAQFPDPDLLIRTSGEQRVSNFMLWQLAYTKIYFTDIFWPDFDGKELSKAISYFGQSTPCEMKHAGQNEEGTRSTRN